VSVIGLPLAADTYRYIEENREEEEKEEEEKERTLELWMGRCRG